VREYMTGNRLYVCVLVLLAWMYVSAISGAAQNGAGAQPPLNSQPSPSKVVAVPVRIAPGDLLDISVFDAPELAQQVRIGADGKAELTLIGNTLLGGLTAQEAAQMIARELRDRNFLLRPQVNVLIKEFASQGASIMGEVQHPGVYPVLGPRTLLDVISMAGGLTNVADTRITVKRRTGAEENVTVKLKNDDVQTSLANDIQIYPGDLVLVPRAGIVYVLGAVNRPGGFVMQDNGKITLLQALAQAGGASTAAAVSHAVLLRRNGEGYVASKLHVGKIALGKDEDRELHPNDIVFIPTNRLKNAVRDTQGMIAAVGSASIYAIIH
jgi:polysaccharide biosynthesis/export protein